MEFIINQNMRKNILSEDVSINLGHFIEAGGSPIDIYIPTDISNAIGDKHLTGKLSSYPIYKNGECYNIECDVDPDMGYMNWGDKSEWFCRLTSLLYPLAMRLKKEYEMMEANTQKEDAPLLINEVRKGDEYLCFHSLYDLYVEELIIDTDKMTIEMELGS